MDLTGKRVVVTGASGVLGSAVSMRAEELGAEVIRLDLRASGNTHKNCFSVDLTNLAAVEDCFEKISGFDALFNIAGGFAMGMKTWENSDEQWDAMFSLNVLTLRNVVKVAVPLLLKNISERGSKASIVNVGAESAKSGAATLSAYCSSKSVVMRLTESLSEELKLAGVNVNAVLPSIINTPANRAAMPDDDYSTWVQPEDLANVICFLGSEAASAIHGSLLPVKGLL